MPELKLYVAAASAPCRAVLLHHRLLGEHAPALEVVPLDLGKGEHKEPAILRSNPLHTVPTIVTAWGPLWESRAIMRFMESMCPEPVGYPTGVYFRAVVDRLLDWDLGTLYRAVSGIVYPQVFRGEDPSTEDLDKLNDATRFLDQKQLGDGRAFLTGADWTIADISCAMTLSLLRLAGLELDDVPRMAAWQQRVAELDVASAQALGADPVDAPFQAWVQSLRTEENPEADAAASGEGDGERELPTGGDEHALPGQHSKAGRANPEGGREDPPNAA